MSMEEKQNQNAGQPENKAKIEPVIRKDRQLKYTGNILKIYEDTVIANVMRLTGIIFIMTELRL